MKHGPIALIDEEMPVVTIAPNDHVFEKMIGNIQEAKARGGSVIALTTEDNRGIQDLLDPKSDFLITIPKSHPLLTPVLWWCRCSCSRTTSPSAAAATSTSRGIWRRASRWNSVAVVGARGSASR